MTNSARPITIKDIAREAGVSVATVSYALRGSPEVSTATCERIEALARKMGYRRNPAFAALGAMAHRHVTAKGGLPLGFVQQSDPNRGKLGDGVKVEGMKEKCAQMGYRLEEFLLDDSYGVETFVKQVVSRGFSGLIIGSLNDFELLNHPGLKRLALVASGRYHQIMPIHTVRGSRYEGASHAVLESYDRGYRKILVMQWWHPGEVMEEDYARYAGVMAAIRQIGPIQDGWIQMVDRPLEVACWRDLIETHQPDAVIGFNEGDYYRFCSAGHTDPSKIGFAVEEVQSPLHEGVVISGVAGRDKEIGKACIEWLDQLIRMGDFGIPELSRSQVFDPVWLEGETLPRK